jgi:hypothetical protein
MRRFWLVAAALAALCDPALAACKAVPAEPPGDYIDALLKRLAPAGVSDIDRVGSTAKGMDRYIILESDVALFLTVDRGQITEIGTVASAPIDDVDARRQLLIVAFTLARYSVNPERVVLDKISADAAAHASAGVWFERFGAATAVFTRSDDALVVKFGKAACD